jgi:ribosomal protein L11 methyltransferase
MALNELRFHLTSERLEQWTDALLAAGAASVSIEDEDSDTPDEAARYGEPGLPVPPPGWKNNRVCVLLDAQVEPRNWLAGVARGMDSQTPPLQQCVRIEDQDWVRQTQSQFAPITIGRIAIVPSWHEPPDPGACIIRVDPGVAFGTGAHPTTRLCLSWLEEAWQARGSVLDYGCGSGILSICAARLGADEVVGVDIDPQAVATAADNARANGVAARYLSPEEFAREPSRTFDLVIANILANPIILLAPTLARRVRAGGTLLLSGILERQAGAVIDAYRVEAPRLSLRVWRMDEGWVALAGTAEA